MLFPITGVEIQTENLQCARGKGLSHSPRGYLREESFGVVREAVVEEAVLHLDRLILILVDSHPLKHEI